MRVVGDGITGREDIEDLGYPGEVLARFYRAFNGRDLSLTKQVHHHGLIDEPELLAAHQAAVR